MKTLLILLYTLLFNLPVEDANLLIIDENTMEVLIGAKVTIDSNEYYTDFNGFVHLNRPLRKNYDVIVEYPSYETKKMEDVDLSSSVIALESK